MKRIILSVTLLFCFTLSLTAQIWDESEVQWRETQMWERAKQHETPEWFMDAKFGIYFHWGVYSYMGHGAWYSRHMYDSIPSGFGASVRPYHLMQYGPDFHYHEFIPKFTAEYFDAKDWAKLFKDSGAKFAGPVAEHCDNFSNWDSKVNKYNTVNYGPKRDLVGELAEAIKAEGLKFVATFHHSWEWGWYNIWSGRIDTSDPEFGEMYGEYTPKETFNSYKSHTTQGKSVNAGQFYSEVDPKYAPSRKFIDTWKQKIFEVIDGYEPDLLYFDSRLFLLPEKDRAEMVNYYYDHAEKSGKEVLLTYKNLDLPVGSAVIDLEQGRMDHKTDYPWLTDSSYPWNDWSWQQGLKNKTPDELLDELIDITSKNGCLIISITPTHDGLIPYEQRAGLLRVGEWLKVNGEAIYDTRPFVVYGEGTTKLKKNSFGGVQAYGVHFTNTDFRFTVNGNALYIIQLSKPVVGDTYSVAALAKGKSSRKIKSVEMLGSDCEVEWEHTAEGFSFTPKGEAPFEEATVYKLQMR